MEREGERENAQACEHEHGEGQREKQTTLYAGAHCRPRSQDPGVMTRAEGRSLTD